MQGYGPATYGDGFADVYDDWYHDVSDIDATVASVRRLANGGPILELGVGTGRIAIPLGAKGETVVGIDASAAMLARLAAKPGADRVARVEADMAELPVTAGRFSLAFAAFNTFFNLTDVDAQRRCLNRVAAALHEGGRLAIEGFVPPAEGLANGGVSVREVTSKAAVITVSQHEADTQIIRGQHVEFTADDTTVRPWVLHYRTPTQLDELAADAGFEREHRWADWAGAEFTADSDSHVSVNRLTR